MPFFIFEHKITGTIIKGFTSREPWFVGQLSFFNQYDQLNQCAIIPE